MVFELVGVDGLNDKAGCILIFSGGQVDVSSPDVRRGLGDAVKVGALRASEVAASTLQENMGWFLSSLDTVIGGSPKQIGGLILDEVEIHAQIDGKGNVGISGIAGTEFAAQTGIKFVLRKKT